MTPSRIERSLRLAAILFFGTLVGCVVLGVLSMERLVAGDIGLGAVLAGASIGGVVWSVWSRYGYEGIYNPSRIHRRHKMR